MRARILSLDSDEHRIAQELMPWFINGSLGSAEAASVSGHLARCSRCQVDAAAQADLRAVAAEVEPGGDVERGWARLRNRIEAVPHPSAAGSAPQRRPGSKQWLAWAVALQAVVVLALALLLVPLRDDRYRALGAGTAPAEANAVAVFRGDATNQQMRGALHAVGARIVGGPTVTGAYLLRFENADPQILARLRAQPGIVSVEGLQRDAAP